MPDEAIKPEGEGINPTDPTNPDGGTGDNQDDIDTIDDVEVLRERAKAAAKAVADAEDAKRQLTARAKKAEDALKAAKPVKVDTAQSPAATDVDERILKAGGMPDELLKELKAVASLRGVSLIDAQSDSLFVAIKEKFEKEKKEKDAELPASRGSGPKKQQKGFDTPGLSAEEHKKLWLDSQK